MESTDNRKIRMNNIRNIIKTSKDIVEATDRLVDNDLCVTKSEARRLWHQVR